MSRTGFSPIWREPATAPPGSFGPGARIDNNALSLTALTTNSLTFPDLLNTVYDDSSFVTTASGSLSGTSELGTGQTAFVIPSGGDGRYDINLVLYLLATTTSFPIQFGFISSKQNSSGSYIQQVRFNQGDLAHYSGMTNNASSTQEGSTSVTAQGVPLVEGDRIVWFVKQVSGSNRTINYASFSLRLVG